MRTLADSIGVRRVGIVATCGLIAAAAALVLTAMSSGAQGGSRPGPAGHSANAAKPAGQAGGHATGTTSGPAARSASGPAARTTAAPGTRTALAAARHRAGRPRAAAAPAYFHTLPPGAKLPSDAQCATWVRARPLPENKGVNRRYDRTAGQHVGRDFFSGDTWQANRLIAPRIDGDFTGTTPEILRWAACKWGIDQDIVFAQAAVESWWRQTTKGDWETSGCPPGHGPGVDGVPGQCPQSWGILQNRYPQEESSWPGIATSTAMNADTAYAIWRTCFDGYETWLNTVQRGATYRKGDAWGCVGRWFAGRWRTTPALQYIAKVKQYLREKIWTTPDFQQP